MVIHWGPQRVALYNDAFAVLIGGKHPAALGRPAKDTWPEAWEVVGGRLDEVIEHGHTMHAEDEQRILHRNGYPEECYFSYLAQPDRRRGRQHGRGVHRVHGDHREGPVRAADAGGPGAGRGVHHRRRQPGGNLPGGAAGAGHGAGDDAVRGRVPAGGRRPGARRSRTTGWPRTRVSRG